MRADDPRKEMKMGSIRRRDVAIRAGKNKTLVANITGITPALLTFRGM